MASHKINVKILIMDRENSQYSGNIELLSRSGHISCLSVSLPGAPEPVVVETNCPTFPVNDKLPPFKLSEGVFSTAAMTRTADDLEMACIGARNSALLVRKYLLDENLIEAPTEEAPEPLEEGPKPLE